jgi:hypothetical protein
MSSNFTRIISSGLLLLTFLMSGVGCTVQTSQKGASSNGEIPQVPGVPTSPSPTPIHSGGNLEVSGEVVTASFSKVTTENGFVTSGRIGSPQSEASELTASGYSVIYKLEKQRPVNQ